MERQIAGGFTIGHGLEVRFPDGRILLGVQLDPDVVRVHCAFGMRVALLGKLTGSPSLAILSLRWLDRTVFELPGGGFPLL